MRNEVPAPYSLTTDRGADQGQLGGASVMPFCGPPAALVPMPRGGLLARSEGHGNVVARAHGGHSPRGLPASGPAVRGMGLYCWTALDDLYERTAAEVRTSGGGSWSSGARSSAVRASTYAATEPPAVATWGGVEEHMSFQEALGAFEDFASDAVLGGLGPVDYHGRLGLEYLASLGATQGARGGLGGVQGGLQEPGGPPQPLLRWSRRHRQRSSLGGADGSAADIAAAAGSALPPAALAPSRPTAAAAIAGAAPLLTAVLISAGAIPGSTRVALSAGAARDSTLAAVAAAAQAVHEATALAEAEAGVPGEAVRRRRRRRAKDSLQLVKICSRVGPLRSPTEDKCTICLEEMCVGQQVRTLPCFHMLHSGCATRYFSASGVAPLCPVCRGHICAAVLGLD